ncbi:MAG: HD-GYP domain-containing protein, partial [Planctomycetaceae bacterium]
RVAGGGYPVGCRRSELHDWARLCTVVDIYEALTSDRPYRSRLPHTEVLRILDRDADKKLDGDYLKCWKNTIAPNSHGC